VLEGKTDGYTKHAQLIGLSLCQPNRSNKHIPLLYE